jgi:hypothetical protein
VSVYSVRFFAGLVAVPTTTIYTVPAATTIVLRDLEVYNSTAAAINFPLYLVPSGSGGFPCIHINSIAPTQSAQWAGRVVLTAGDALQTSQGQTGVYLTLSGYNLGS